MFSLQTFAIPGSIFLSILSGFLFPFPLALFLVCLVSGMCIPFCDSFNIKFCNLVAELVLHEVKLCFKSYLFLKQVLFVFVVLISFYKIAAKHLCNYMDIYLMILIYVASSLQILLLPSPIEEKHCFFSVVIVFKLWSLYCNLKDTYAGFWPDECLGILCTATF